MISKLAMLAVQRETKHDEAKLLNATFVIAGFFSGHKAVRQPIIIPIDPGFAKLQIANVAIAEDLICKKTHLFFFLTTILYLNIPKSRWPPCTLRVF